MSEIRIYNAKWQPVKMMLLASLFVVPAVYLLWKGENTEDRTLLWISTCFFGLAYPLGIFSLVDRRPQLVINEIGIYGRVLSKKVVNWEVIQDAYIKKMRRQKFICLVIDEQFGPSAEKGEMYKAVVKLNKSLGFEELNIMVSNLAVKPDNLLSLILQAKDAQPAERKAILVLDSKLC